MLQMCTMPSHSESYATPRSGCTESSFDKNVKKDSEETSSPSPSNASSARDGVRSAPSHFSQAVSQALTEKLVDNSEQCSLDDILVFESSVLDDWSEAASGWREVVPYPKYISGQPPPRNKSETSLKKGHPSSRTMIHCIDEDFGDDQYCPPWKANVEPVTYRYVPNNGYYRDNKNNRGIQDWHSQKKSRSGKSIVTPEMRQAQKTLKRDLENHFKGSGEENSTTATQEPVEKPQQTQAQQREICTEITHSIKRLPAKEQQLMKSASDLFMENFNTRLGALHKEIQTPYGPIITKRVDFSNFPNHSPTQITKKLREVRANDTMKSTIQASRQHSANFGEDLFTVIPMCKPEVPLRPLEKLTPKHKQMEKSASRDRSPTPKLVSQADELEGDDYDEEDIDDDEEMMIMLAAATTQPHSFPKGAEPSGINTAHLALAMTNFDIEKTRNVALPADYSGRKPKPFVVGKAGGPSSQLSGAMRYTLTNSAQTQEQAATGGEGIPGEEFYPNMERRMEKEVDSMGASLPGIMGKRLSVITTTHRLL
ncbi:uncharacterized protein [Littorina saxatilis]|uniref:Uncharacterized protein n=1 Tax=Littorina saxatilis TaxID=31220 RepID=A0AAN9C1H3_9CAEN